MSNKKKVKTSSFLFGKFVSFDFFLVLELSQSGPQIVIDSKKKAGATIPKYLGGIRSNVWFF